MTSHVGNVESEVAGPSHNRVQVEESMETEDFRGKRKSGISHHLKLD